MPANRALRLVLIALSVLAGLVLIASFGAPLPSDPFASVELKGPSAVSSDGSLTAVIFDQARKVALIDDEGRLAGLIDCNTFESPIEVATEVCVSDERVYVAGVTRNPGSDHIAFERVVAFNREGKQLSTIYEIEGRDTMTRLRSLDDQDDDVIVGRYVEDDKGVADHVVFEKANDGDHRQVASSLAAYYMLVDASYGAGRAATLSYRGIIDDVGKDDLSSQGNRTYCALSVADDAAPSWHATAQRARYGASTSPVEQKSSWTTKHTNAST